MCIKTSLVERAPSGCQAYFSCGNFSARAMSFFSGSSMERVISALKPVTAGVACDRAMGARTASPRASAAVARTLVKLVRVVTGVTVSFRLPAREGASPQGIPFYLKGMAVYRDSGKMMMIRSNCAWAGFEPAGLRPALQVRDRFAEAGNFKR